MSVSEFLHVPLVVSAYFLAFDSLVEQISVKLTHQPEASPHEVAILLKELLFGVLTGADRGLREVDGWDGRIRLADRLLGDVVQPVRVKLLPAPAVLVVQVSVMPLGCWVASTSAT